MLTSATKRKIDNARDILVGKIPMPTTQVEQITLALIYKFMSDIDKKSKALGDTSGFFANGYEKYSWDNLMDKSLSARERVTLYSEGLEKMSKNPHIPQLFRDIFKNAFLPFRSPETLKLFLEQIDEFEYDHSEELGNAFEYLLSVMGSQGDAGQFRTPRHIIDFIVKVVDPSKTDTILDPACGTAGFLISAYKHIKEKGLTAEEQKKLTDNFVGYDISHDMQRLAMVNMYLHHFPDPHIYEYDTLSSEDRWDDDFDVILANPPFMTPTGGIRPHGKFSIQTSRAEALFVSYIMEHLTNKGRSGVIVPEGIIFKTDSAYKSLRKMMVEDNYLWAVVSLPSGVFNPYAGVKTSILFFDKEIARKTDKILFVKAESDGFDLGAQRRKVKQNDLLLAEKLLLKFKQSILDGKELSINDVIELGGSTSDKKRMSSYGFDLDAQDHIQLSQIVNRAYNEIAKTELKGTDFNLSGERYKLRQVNKNQKYDLVKLSKVVEINPKKSQIKGLDENMEISFLPMSDLNENNPDFVCNEKRKIADVYKGYTYFADDDVLLAKITPCFENGKAGIAKNLLNGIGFGSTEYHVLRADQSKILPEYIYYMLASSPFRKTGQANMTGSAGQKRVPTDFLKSFRIPLLPLQLQEELIEEIDRYQRIINGSRQVANNWKPKLEVSHNWNLIKLSDLIESTKLGIVIPKKDQRVGDIPYIKMDAINDGFLNLNKAVFVNYKPSNDDYLMDGDFIYNTRNAPNLVGKSAVFHSDKKYLFNNNILRIRFDRSRVNPDFINYFMSGKDGKKLLHKFIAGTTSVAAIYQKEYLSISVPLPSLKTQNKIISEIEREKDLINKSLETIQLFEKKIRAKINEIWNK